MTWMYQLKNIFFNSAKISTVLQILLFLPLTLSTLSTPAFLVFSLLLFIHSLIHGTLLLLFGPGILSLLQVPVHPFLLLVCFNLFSHDGFSSILTTAAAWWGRVLTLSTPVFIIFEALSSLLVAQSLGQGAKDLAAQSESWQFGLLIGSAAAYVAATYWIVLAYPAAAASPLASTLLGVTTTAFIFLTLIGFSSRRTNVVESSCLALYLAFNIWLSGFTDASFSDPNASYAPLWENILPHMKTMLSFITNTLPKPVLLSLLYRLTVLHLSSRILPEIGADAWESEGGIDGDWDGRPTSRLTKILLTYRQSIFITTYTHLLLLDHSSQVWWRHMCMITCLSVWALELHLTGGDDDEMGSKSWKVD
ncbi:hypothetical protein SISNIDRAFT_548113 [Sistotremastrum niveocremeum HHB9708]|uniref:ICE2-domain-containing protein n=2 Tax=Sistotremastraceae TaxID=3402574 RepID=A0A164XHQ0_9AGAM|nr:hypothetical protein SISNIDRAFT_548113 [Sistotremastrum niveocremeum HHB9708]KZT37406.1 hypothetical protein SISSUDRAFT_1129634 [Sistotremastrum suecicum HHB10207 ss-3]